MRIDPDRLVVIQNREESRFEVWIDGYFSELDYRQDKETFVIAHVGVNPQHQGQGVAGKLTQTALEYARRLSLRVIPLCSYAAAYIRRNPQYDDLTSPQDI
jgi:hypothetical protein